MRFLLALLLGLLSFSSLALAVFPQPKSIKLSGASVSLNPSGLQFATQGPGGSSERLQRACQRYEKLIYFSGPSSQSAAVPSSAAAVLKTVNVNVKLASETLNATTSESYTLSVPGDGSPAAIVADTIYGAMRALETLSQLVTHADNGHSGTYQVAVGNIQDEPRFAWRGLLIDSSRHFLPVSVIKRQLDAMAYSKLNVLHWHIVDSQAFPYPSTSHPKLIQGAYSPIHTYTQAQIAEIIAFAMDRGIRVVAEFDTPGHSFPSWGVGYPELLTPCQQGGVNGLGPLNPISPYTYDFMDALLKEVGEVFPDTYVHLGGDEVAFTCWQNNSDISAFMQKQGWGSNYARLEQYYEQKLLDIAEKNKLSYVIWQDVIDNGVKLAADTVVEVWKGGNGGWQDEMSKVTAAGYRTILSSPWYLNYISYGEDWVNYYNQEPTNFSGTAQQKSLLMGGEACMWGEYVDATNLISRFFPRASVVGERLWSPMDVRDVADATARLHVFRCTLLRRGIGAEPPNGPSFCDQIWDEPYSPPY